MTETTMKNVPTLNAVDGFNPAEFTRELPNEDGTSSLYLDVKYRLLWFRLHRPNGKINTEIIHVDDKSAIVSCKLYSDKCDKEEQYIARSCAQRFLTQEKYGDRYLEIAETAALGRVLAAAGYGTQFCGSTDMLGDVIVDAPVDFAKQEDSGSAASDSSNRVVHQTKSLPTTNAPAQPVPMVQSQPKPKVSQPMTVEEYLNCMTIEEAKNVVVDIGRYAGTRLGDVVMSNPRDLEWYVKNYVGRNAALKAGAILLMQAATSKAS